MKHKILLDSIKALPVALFGLCLALIVTSNEACALDYSTNPLNIGLLPTLAIPFAGPVILGTLSPMHAAAALGWIRDKDDERAPYDFAETGKIQINSVKFGQCLARAAWSFASIPPSMDQSKVFCLDTATDQLVDLKECPTFVVYLSGPIATHKTYVTGREQALKQWVLGQPPNSIDPFKLFRHALFINRGNIWSALLTIHQTLRPVARWYDSHYDGHTTAKEAREFFNRFIDIRGDLWEAFPGKLHGDHAGTWYRVWGAMLYQLSFLNEHQLTMMAAGDGFGGETRFERMMEGVARATTTMVFYTEERIIKTFPARESDFGKYRMDISAARAANFFYLNSADFKAAANVTDPRLQLPSLERCSDRTYLTHLATTWDDVIGAEQIRLDPRLGTRQD